MSDPDQTFEHIEAKAATEATGAYVPLESATTLVLLLDQYLADLQAGKAPDKIKMLAEHPELAQQLEQCLSGIEFVHRAAKPAGGVPTQLGDFRVIREVGRGGMGVVYEAEQISLKRKVALKVLRFGATADPEVMKRFQREAETVAHLHHTNIVPIHAVGCEQGVNYYAMQFIEGHSLAEKVGERHGPPIPRNFREIAGWALQAAEALAHAHHRGVIHRDIKPSNLILDPEGTVWLTDFGLAKRADEVTMTAAGVLMGTPRYMSPEQAASAKQPVDHRTDIYSLGATLYELATGKPVFDSQTPQGVITQILNTEPVSPRLIQGQMPRDLETIILKCLAKEPYKRYQQARDLADDLRSYLENRAIKARRPSLAERTVRWAKKQRASAIIAGVAAVVAVVLMVGGYFAYDAYRAAQMSHLSLTTDGPALVAEVLDDKGDLVVASFPVPTPQPVTLPAGSYRLRLSGSGQLSENWDITLERGQQHDIPVKMFERFLGPAPEIYGPDPPMLIELNGQMHIFHRTQRGWRLVNGATLASVWPSDLLKYPEKPEQSPKIVDNLLNDLLLKYPEKPEQSPFFRGRGGNEVDLLQAANFNATGSAPGLARPAIDVDGDGKDDLIIASRFSPSLLAVSGKDGKVLWWHRASPNFPKKHDWDQDPFEPRGSHEDAGVLGQPITVNIDGEPAVVAAFLSFEATLRTKAGNNFSTRNVCAIEAIAARTGKKLWRTVFELPELVGAVSRDLGEFIPSKLEIGNFNGQVAVLLAINSKIFGLDLQTGKELWPAYDLGVRLAQSPQFVDFDGDGQTDALVLYRKKVRSEEHVLRLMSLITGATVWEHSFLCPVPYDAKTWRSPGTELAWVADVHGDGKPLVIIPVQDDWGKYGNHWIGVEALDGATGAHVWQRRLEALGSFSSSDVSNISIRALTGPDLNGDGHAEIFIASVSSKRNYSVPNESAFLQIHALSGKDGNVLWKSRHKIANDYTPQQPPGALQWWQVGVDGWPQLVVPVSKGIGGQPLTYILSASSGKVADLLPEIGNVQVADINSDGLPDLFHLASSQGARRLVVFKGLPPLVWRRPGNLRAGGDYDGDGIVDILEVNAGLNALSGSDGRLLWHAKISLDQYYPRTPVLSVDVDGDGVADVVVLERYFASNGDSRVTVSAFSGKDGHVIWRGPDFGPLNFAGSSGWGGGSRTDYTYPLLDHVDLDGDGRPEILLAANMGNLGLCVVALSGKDGSLRWKIPIVQGIGSYTGQTPIDRHRFYDLNGDGVLDLVLWVPEKIDKNGNQAGYALRAFSGRDGKPLWPESADRLTQNYFLWPRVAIADLDGDGIPEVVVTTNDGKGYNADKQGYPCELVVLNGRDGKPKWRWSWASNSFDFWPPLLVDPNGDGKRVLCMAVQESGASQGKIMVFDADGSIRDTIPVPSLAQGDRAWAALDPSGAGKEILLYRKEDKIMAHSLAEQKELWSWTSPGGGVQFEKLWPGSKDKSGTLVQRNDQTLYFVDAQTGAARWRCEVPIQDNVPTDTELNYPLKSTTQPLVLSHSQNRAGTIAQRLLPTQANGRYQPARPEPITFSSENMNFSDETENRTLSWSNKWVAIIQWVTFVGFVLPLLFRSLRRNWRRAIAYLILALLLSISVTYWIASVDFGDFGWNERYPWVAWGRIIFQGVFLGFIPFFLWMILSAAVRIGRWFSGSPRKFGEPGV